MPEEHDLDLVSTEDLFHALSRRCDAGVFVMVRKGLRGDGKDGIARCWVGDAFTCLGIVQHVSASILEEIQSDSYSDEEGLA